MQLFGLTLDGDDIDPGSIAVAAVLVIEAVGDNGPYLQLMSSDMPIWRRYGILATITASEAAEAANAFNNDDDDDDA